RGWRLTGSLPLVQKSLAGDVIVGFWFVVFGFVVRSHGVCPLGKPVKKRASRRWGWERWGCARVRGDDLADRPDEAAQLPAQRRRGHGRLLVAHAGQMFEAMMQPGLRR